MVAIRRRPSSSGKAAQWRISERGKGGGSGWQIYNTVKGAATTVPT